MNILITGATSGLGKEIFNELKKDKSNYFFLLNRKSKIKNKNVKTYNVNLSNHKKLKKKIKIIINNSKKKIDLIICNAAQGVFGSIDKIKINNFQNDMDVNFYSHLFIIKSLLPFMKRNRNGHIVNIASGAGIVGLKNSSSYSVSKSCMQILIESIHNELTNIDRTIIVMVAGLIDTFWYVFVAMLLAGSSFIDKIKKYSVWIDRFTGVLLIGLSLGIIIRMFNLNN